MRPKTQLKQCYSFLVGQGNTFFFIIKEGEIDKDSGKTCFVTIFGKDSGKTCFVTIFGDFFFGSKLTQILHVDLFLLKKKKN